MRGRIVPVLLSRFVIFVNQGEKSEFEQKKIIEEETILLN